MPGVVTRQFPDASQLNVANGTVINQSRITFSGQRGTIVAGWHGFFRNAQAVAVNSARIEVLGTALAGVSDQGTMAWMDAVIGRDVGGWIWVVVADPSDASFLEARVAISASGVDVLANFGQLVVISFPRDAAEGPTVTVS